jgi:hypothetical protein
VLYEYLFWPLPGLRHGACAAHTLRHLRILLYPGADFRAAPLPHCWPAWRGAIAIAYSFTYLRAPFAFTIAPLTLTYMYHPCLRLPSPFALTPLLPR